jgi:hypothetical protein
MCSSSTSTSSPSSGEVTPAIVDAFSAEECHQWILQERVTYGMWVPVSTGYTSPSDDDRRLTNVGTEVR